MTKKDFLISFVVATFVVVVGGLGFIYWVSKGEAQVNTKTVKDEVIQKSVDTALSTDTEGKTNLEKEAAMGGFLDEKVFQQMLHEMSHQKVHASQKWGFIEMKESTINALLKMLENGNYENENLYREILTEWKEGNFKNAVEHHNAIWKLQGGSIGKATRLLTEEEEQKYLESFQDTKFVEENGSGD